jgi:predicted MFS family arabinose efflux permease
MERRFGLGALPIGGILALAGVSQLAAARALPPLLRRVSERSLLAMGGGAMASAYLLSAVAWSWWYVAASCLLIGAGFSLCHSTLQTRASEAFTRGRGTALSLFAFSLFSGSALGSVCVGYASEWLGYGPTFGAAGVLLLAFTGVVVRVLGRRQTVASATAQR